ncbi:hypothetical protein VCHA50O413_130031 [Vibrio chagasii]|jgi:hypothetical protein|nr:hypothetical protein VCHA28FP16_190048 [Vibrio chagasii]CAH6838346.1 hypothetical protein VCHA36P161_180036 [Vibrio chagasii]CAH6858624.1 hypothetical protein VCHA34P129_220048 [Vibrio chagasii]CAH6860056.1 hypothetical protein VCHA34P115_220035 [Vibrio chagasii]CAH6866212.1 hypothetical protein VCHA35O142_220005 [Vibrio chagasii]
MNSLTRYFKAVALRYFLETKSASTDEEAISSEGETIGKPLLRFKLFRVTVCK